MEGRQSPVSSERGERTGSELTISTVVVHENEPEESNQTYFVDELIEIPNLGQVFVLSYHLIYIRLL